MRHLRQLVLQPPLNFILITNRFRLLRSFYNRMYSLTLKIAAFALAAIPGIDAIFCRKNKFIGWLPGVSDLDLTIILSCELSAESREITTRSIRKRLKLLKYFCPILGETLIFSHSEYQDYLKFGPSPLNSLRDEIPLFVTDAFDRIDLTEHRGGFSPDVLFVTAVERLVNIGIPLYIEAFIDNSRLHRARLDRILNQAATRLRVCHDKRPFVTKSPDTAEEALLTVIDLAVRPCSDELVVSDRAANFSDEGGLETDDVQSMTVQNPFVPGEELRIFIFKEGLQLTEKQNSLRKLAADLAATEWERIKRGNLKILLTNQEGWLSALEVFPLYLSAVVRRMSEQATKKFAKRVYGNALCSAKSEPNPEKASELLQKKYLPALGACKTLLDRTAAEPFDQHFSSVDSCLAYIRHEVATI